MQWSRFRRLFVSAVRLATYPRVCKDRHIFCADHNCTVFKCARARCSQIPRQNTIQRAHECLPASTTLLTILLAKQTEPSDTVVGGMGGWPLVDDEFTQISVITASAAERGDRAEDFNVTNPPSYHAHAFFVCVCCRCRRVACSGVLRIKMCMCTDFDYYNFSAVCLRVTCFDYSERVRTFRLAV